MIQKSIKIGIKRLLKFKAYSSINIGGLAIAITVCLLILLYTYHHSSFDKYISNGDNSYRLISRVGDGTYNTNTFAGFEDALSAFPEIESYTLFYTNHRIDEVFVEENKFEVKAAILANESFLKYFSVKMIEGDMRSINQPNSILITPKMADKLFPGKQAMGQTVFIRSFTRNRDSLLSYTISGIIEPLPTASHIKYEMLLSQQGHFYPTVEVLKSRKVFGSNLYLKLHPSANVQDLEKRLAASLEPILGNAFGPPLEAINHKLQALYDIHFTPGLVNEMQPTVRRSSHTILILVGFLILVLATMNFVIMYVARASFYQKASLIIRFFGGTNKHLFVQTAIEVLISVCISFFLAIVLLVLFRNYLGTQFFSEWKIPFQSSSFWIILISLFLGINIIVSNLTSLNLLKRGTILHQTTETKKFRAAKLLVIFQFAMVIALIGFTIVINLQMKFIDKKDLGYSSKNVIVINVPQSNTKVHILKDDLAIMPGIESTGTAHHYPGYRLQDMNFSIEGNPYPFKFGFIDQQAIQTLDIKPLMYFTDAKEKATNGWIINETFYNNLLSKYNFEQIATSNFPFEENKKDNASDEKFIIHGVVSDFCYASLHSEIENFAFYIAKPEARNNRFVLVRFEQKRMKEVVAAIEDKIAEIYPGQPIKYSFLNEQIKSQYASEQILLKLINTFSILAILVACFGLIGLSIFIAEKRTKEIGIRKVNGASVFEILRLLNVDFALWVGIAFVIATPLAIDASQKWLENFAYRISAYWWVFILSGILALVIALITVSWQTIIAAQKNPVDVLKYE